MDNKILNNGKNRNMKFSCDFCVLPSVYEWSDSKIVDGKQRCKFCECFTKHTFLGKQQFIKDIGIKKNEKIGITVSGGKDSIYAWKQLVEIFGKERVVAFTYYKPHLTHELALKNIENASRILGSKFYTFVDQSSFDRFKRNIENFLNNPNPAMVRVALCAGCRYGITEQLYNFGFKKEKITKYISAASYLELAPFKEELLKHAGSGSEKFGLIKCLAENNGYSFGNNIEIILRDDNYRYKGVVSKNENNFTQHGKFILFDFDKYFPNIPEKIESIVKKELKWKRPERSWHFDCLIENFKDVFYYGLLGYTETDFKLSAMVREGLMTREEAIIKLEKFNKTLETSFNDIKKLMIDLEISDLIPKMKDFYKKSKFLLLENENE